jgi:hypothetical protein
MTEMGTVVTFPKEAFAAPTSGGSGATVGQYVIKSLAQDYFGCVTWDGTTEGTETVYVAKPYDLRGSLASEYLDPTTIATTYLYSYSYTAGQSYLRRTASVTISGTTTTEKQDIVPRYKIGSKILAASVESSGILGPDSVEITLIDLNISARAWCRAYTQ